MRVMRPSASVRSQNHWEFGDVGTLTVKCVVAAANDSYPYGFGNAQFSD